MHTCQPASSIGTHDDDFPEAFRKNPFCWSEDLGFHRADKPAKRLDLQIATGVRVVAKGSMHAHQAARLGLGVGISNSWGLREHIGECLARVIEATEHTGYQGGALDVWARYGAAAKGKNFDRSLEDIQEVARIMIRTLILSQPTFPHRQAYERLVDDRSTLTDRELLGGIEYAEPVVRVLFEGWRYGGVTRQIHRLYHQQGSVTAQTTDSMADALTEHLKTL